MNQLALTFGIILAVFLGGLEVLLLWFIATDKINLTHLVSEKGGAASLSRFQFLIFTFVIAMSFFLIVAAVALTAMLFRFNVEQRNREIIIRFEYNTRHLIQEIMALEEHGRGHAR